MKKLLLIAALMVGASGAYAEPVNLLVDFKDDASADDIRQVELETGTFGQLQPNSEMYSADKLTIGTFDREQAEVLVAKLSDNSLVEVAEIEQVYSIPSGEEGTTFDQIDGESVEGMDDSTSPTPNDKYWPKQMWNFEMIGLQRAWQMSQGEGVVVAVLDTGISDGSDPAHPRVKDLENTCFKPGYNFINKNTNPYDAQSHGSHVGSTIAESTNNKIGGVGIAYKACLMPVKVLSDQGSGGVAGISDGIRWATDHGANIINMSLGGGGHSKEMASAVKYAADHNVLVFCAAGNGSRDVIEYPAAYDGCLAISSVGPSGQKGGTPGSDPVKAELAYYSSHGKGGPDGKAKLFIAAPGGDKQKFGDDGAVWQSTVNPNNVKEWVMAPYQGTSMATPTAAGSAALVVAFAMKANGGKFKSKDITAVMADTAVDKGDTYKFGAGVVNPANALEKLNKHDNHFTLFAVLGSALALFVVRRFFKKTA